MNYQIKSKIKDLYSDIKFWKEEVLPESKQPEKILEKIASIKKEIRRKYFYSAQDAKEFESCKKFEFYRDDGYTFIQYQKVQFDSYERAKEICDEYYRDHQICSAYDCTGERFVSSINFAHMRDNIYLVRIRWGLDV